MSELQVELVAADRRVWTGGAKFVRVRTTEGDLGILPGHSPILGVLVGGDVLIDRPDGGRDTATIDEGFLSVDRDRVTIVAQTVTSAGLASPAHT